MWHLRRRAPWTCLPSERSQSVEVQNRSSNRRLAVSPLRNAMHAGRQSRLPPLATFETVSCGALLLVLRYGLRGFRPENGLDHRCRDPGRLIGRDRRWGHLVVRSDNGGLERRWGVSFRRIGLLWDASAFDRRDLVFHILWRRVACILVRLDCRLGLNIQGGKNAANRLFSHRARGLHVLIVEAWPCHIRLSLDLRPLRTGRLLTTATADLKGKGLDHATQGSSHCESRRLREPQGNHYS